MVWVELEVAADITTIFDNLLRKILHTSAIWFKFITLTAFPWISNKNIDERQIKKSSLNTAHSAVIKNRPTTCHFTSLLSYFTVTTSFVYLCYLLLLFVFFGKSFYLKKPFFKQTVIWNKNLLKKKTNFFLDKILQKNFFPKVFHFFLKKNVFHFFFYIGHLKVPVHKQPRLKVVDWGGGNTSKQMVIASVG